jgi:hypothetical protein
METPLCDPARPSQVGVTAAKAAPVRAARSRVPARALRSAREPGRREGTGGASIVVWLSASMGLAVVIALTTTAEKRVGMASSIPLSTDSAECVEPGSLFIEDVQTVVSSSDSISGIAMRSIAHLPALPVDSVSAVMDEATCHRALVASGLASPAADSAAFSSVSVVRVGATRYVVSPTGSHSGEWTTRLTFDTTFSVPPLAVWSQ